MGLVAGLLVLGVLTGLAVIHLEREAMEQALAGQERRLERHVGTMVRRLASEEKGDLGRVGARLVAAAEGIPAILDLVVVDPHQRVVRHFSRSGESQVPCVAVVPLDASRELEHAAGEVAPHAVACRTVPVVVDGQARGAVLFHSERDSGTRAAGWVKWTAFRLGPVFLASYVLLGLLLIAASRAARRWRDRAASAERVQALSALADGINHEIKNPLNSLGLSLQLIARKHADPETREVVDTAGREAERIFERLEEFVRFTRVSHLVTERVALGERLRDRYGRHAEIAGNAEARVDVSKVDDAVAAIVEFLGRDGGEGPRLSLSGTRSEWRLVAEGPSPAGESREVGQLFDPYVRTGPHDVGRGLALARAVFQAHGGDLVAQRRGTRLVLRGSAPKVPPGDRR
ncbi:MAG: histidine kinase dimerization/phospho-acceptor domain-containing protein [Planctomycetota bacterium]